MKVLIVGPGRGIQLEHHPLYKGRILIPVYQQKGAGVIYSDDFGATFRYAKGANVDTNEIAMSESQLVEMPDGSLRVFARSDNRRVAAAASLDGGETWSDAVQVEGIKQPIVGSQLSVINFNGEIDGKPAILLSTPEGIAREDGHIRIGLITDTRRDGIERYSIDWHYDYQVDKDEYYGYSCLTQLNNQNIGILYERYDSYDSTQVQSRDTTIFEILRIDDIKGR